MRNEMGASKHPTFLRDEASELLGEIVSDTRLRCVSTSGFHWIVIWIGGVVNLFAVSSLHTCNRSMVMQPRDRKAGRRAELVRRESSMKVTRLGSVRVVQEATKEPWGLAEIEAELKLLQDNWVGTYQQRRGYKELCSRRDAMLGKSMRLLGEQSIAKKGKPHYAPAGGM